ncbi:hypothetical protein [Fibrobacter sp. HC4]|uniref:hypothetical protein n=1 Tax=Fibrobacter sp. HC4 TaxID=3239812 RepID=UPI0020194471|nr:hypothetical protein [Fibrobacter succinogenes]
MNRKILTLLTAASFALFFGACGDDNSASSNGPEISCLDNEDCLDEDLSSADDEPTSSSSKKGDAKSSSSVKDSKDENKSSSSVKKDNDEGKSSSSETKDDKSSDSKSESSNSKGDSSSSETQESSSSEASESSSSEEVKPVEYANTTPNLADLEVSGDTLFAVFQRQNADYSITHNGLLAMYKLSDGTLLDTIQLATKNPSAVKVAGGNVYVATAGAYGAGYSLPADNNRGIEKVDLSKKTSSLFIAGTKLGGGVQDFVVDKKNNMGYATVYYGYGSVAVAEINLATGSVMTLPDFADASGSLEFDESTSTLYVGDRFMDWNTGDMHIGVFKYMGGLVEAVSDAEEGLEVRQPYSIKAINSVPYVFVSDYHTGALYVDYADSESDGTDFFQDSKLAAVNGELFLMERGDAATIAKINTADGSATWQSIASGKNPYDMVAASASTAWVAYYGSPVLELISTSNGSSVKLIDTKEFCAVKVAD